MLHNLADKTDDKFKCKAYRRAANSVYELPYKITSGKAISQGPNKVPGVGKSIAKLARDMFKQECGFDDRVVPQLWNPFMCRNKVNGWVWIQCYKNDKYGRPLVSVYRNRGDKLSVNQKMIASGIVNVYNGKTKAVFR